jgi:hypothetical protein
MLEPQVINSPLAIQYIPLRTYTNADLLTLIFDLIGGLVVNKKNQKTEPLKILLQLLGYPVELYKGKASFQT